MGYLHLARDEQEEVGPYGSAPQQSRSEGRSQTGAADPAAISIDTHVQQIADMIRAVHENGTPLLDGYGARHPVEIILGIYESARTGKEVRLS